MALIVAALAIPAAPALAAPCGDRQTSPQVVAGFEIDGNLCLNTSGTTGTDDWDTVNGTPVQSDPAGGSDTSAWTGGASEGGWPWAVSQTQGTNPSGGSDITHVFAFSRIVGEQVLAYFGWERVAGTGSAGFYVELNQLPNRFGPVPDRISGDLRFRFTQSGNTLLTLDEAYRWRSTGANSGVWDRIPPADYVAAVNGVAVSNLPGLTPNPLSPGTFAEVALNISALFADLGGCSGRFGTLNLRSVSNVQATDPGLQDWVAPIDLGVPPTCPEVVLRKHWLNGATGDTAGLSINGEMVHLGSAGAGQRIAVLQGGARSRYRVVRTAVYDRGNRLPQRYFSTTGRHRLVLISCTDRVVYPNGHFHYTRYVVVVARAVRPPERR